MRNHRADRQVADPDDRRGVAVDVEHAGGGAELKRGGPGESRDVARDGQVGADIADGNERVRHAVDGIPVHLQGAARGPAVPDGDRRGGLKVDGPEAQRRRGPTRTGCRPGWLWSGRIGRCPRRYRTRPRPSTRETCRPVHPSSFRCCTTARPPRWYSTCRWIGPRRRKRTRPRRLPQSMLKIDGAGQSLMHPGGRIRVRRRLGKLLSDLPNQRKAPK